MVNSWTSHVLLGIRCKEIEEKLANDKTLFHSERKALLEEKTKLYQQLYPETEEGR